MTNETQLQDISRELSEQGYSLVRGGGLDIDPASRAHVDALAAEWDDLELDHYLKDGARFRERRYGRFRYVPATGDIRQARHEPYFQSENANSYAGGIARVVAPLTPTTTGNPLLHELIRFNFRQFPADPALRGEPWHVACHMFRIIARPSELGEPTPEGIHRDEIDFGALHLMSRSNADGGWSRIYDNERRFVSEFQLESVMDTMFWADNDVLHAVTPITVVDSSRPAVRDILILGYRCDPELGEDD